MKTRGVLGLCLGLGLALSLPTSRAIADDDAPIKCEVTEKDEGKSWFVTVGRIPKSVEEFKALRDELCKTPQGGMVAFIIAMHMHGENEELGLQVLPLILDKSLLGETINMQQKYQKPGYKGWQIGGAFDQMRKSSGFQKAVKYAALSYVVGTKKDDGYKLPAPPYKYYCRIHRVPPKEGEWKGFLNTSGSAGGAVPYIMKKDSNGNWKMLQASSFFAGTQEPPKKSKDDL
ncbi:MAG: hypothetical protein AB7N76_23480 [Planctomycetota bacterium]